MSNDILSVGFYSFEKPNKIKSQIAMPLSDRRNGGNFHARSNKKLIKNSNIL